jgi:hypothetical protein
MIRLAFAQRFIVYTLSILLTAALLLTVRACPPAIDVAAVPLAVFAGFTILGTRGFMFALGCIQSQSCHTDRCPVGVTTQDPSR